MSEKPQDLKPRTKAFALRPAIHKNRALSAKPLRFRCLLLFKFFACSLPPYVIRMYSKLPKNDTVAQVLGKSWPTVRPGEVLAEDNRKISPKHP